MVYNKSHTKVTGILWNWCNKFLIMHIPVNKLQSFQQKCSLTGSSKFDLKVSENTLLTILVVKKKKQTKSSVLFCKEYLFERFSLRDPQKENAGGQTVAFTPVNGSLSRLEQSIREYELTHAQEGFQSSLIVSPALRMDLTLFPAGLSSVHTPSAPTQPASITVLLMLLSGTCKAPEQRCNITPKKPFLDEAEKKKLFRQSAAGSALARKTLCSLLLWPLDNILH